MLNSSPINTQLKTGRKSAWTKLYIWENENIAVGDSVYKTGKKSGTTPGEIINTCVTAMNTDF